MAFDEVTKGYKNGGIDETEHSRTAVRVLTSDDYYNDKYGSSWPFLDEKWPQVGDFYPYDHNLICVHVHEDGNGTPLKPSDDFDAVPGNDADATMDNSFLYSDCTITLDYVDFSYANGDLPTLDLQGYSRVMQIGGARLYPDGSTIPDSSLVVSIPCFTGSMFQVWPEDPTDTAIGLANCLNLDWFRGFAPGTVRYETPDIKPTRFGRSPKWFVTHKLDIMVGIDWNKVPIITPGYGIDWVFGNPNQWNYGNFNDLHAG